MKRKTSIILTGILLSLVLTSCGNKQVFDTTYTFKTAIIGFPDGTNKTITISSWTDYEDGDQIQVKDSEGVTYLVHSSNIVLISE